LVPTLRYGSHAGPVIARTHDGSLRLWADSAGLAFEAVLDDADVSAWHTIAAGGLGCSINMRIVSAAETMVGHRRIRSAILDDVALCANPVYGKTAVWPAGVAIDALPSAAVRGLARAWGLGYQKTVTSRWAPSPGGVAEAGWS
jgi:hypothetical protein